MSNKFLNKIMNIFGYVSKNTFNVIQNAYLERIEYLSEELKISDEKVKKAKECCLKNEELNKQIKKLETKILYLEKHNRKFLGLTNQVSPMAAFILENEAKELNNGNS